jgi:hypothetical protein
MHRRTFVRAGALAAGGLLLPRLGSARGRLASYLVPMDDSQSDHLKAYGVAFRALERGEQGEWLLNYRGGSFLLPASDAVRRDAAIAGVALDPADAGQVADIHAGIDRSNMDAVPLEKAPKMAVYAPPNAAPWDDAVTMVLEYAGISYDRVWDPEVLGDRLGDWDWLHLHHEDFTGQYSKFVVNSAGAPWLQEMMEQNRTMAAQLGFPHVPALKRAVATRIVDFVEDGGFLFAMCSHRND